MEPALGQERREYVLEEASKKVQRKIKSRDNVRKSQEDTKGKKTLKAEGTGRQECGETDNEDRKKKEKNGF